MLELDATEDPQHGQQAGGFLTLATTATAICRSMPSECLLDVFCGRLLLAAKLCRCDIDGSDDAIEPAAPIGGSSWTRRIANQGAPARPPRRPRRMPNHAYRSAPPSARLRASVRRNCTAPERLAPLPRRPAPSAAGRPQANDNRRGLSRHSTGRLGRSAKVTPPPAGLRGRRRRRRPRRRAR